jgi:hypothetical protein
MEAMAHLQMIDLLLFEWSCCSIANREKLREGIYTTEWSSYFSSIESQGLLSQSGFVQRKHRENHDRCREKDRQLLAGWYRRWFPHVQASKLSIYLPQNKGYPKIPWFIPHFVKHIHSSAIESRQIKIACWPETRLSILRYLRLLLILIPVRSQWGSYLPSLPHYPQYLNLFIHFHIHIFNLWHSININTPW